MISYGGLPNLMKWDLGQVGYVDIPRPLVEIKIATGPFGLASLEVHGLAAGVFLGAVKGLSLAINAMGKERLAVIIVHNEAPRVDSSQEKVALVVGGGVGGNTKRLVHGYPSHSLEVHLDRKSTRLNSSHANISYAVFCLKK